MTQPLRYYQPLEVPRACYIWEAVLWATFGRFPDGTGDDDPIADEVGRYSTQWQDSIGGPGYKFRGFWWYETEMAGVDPEPIDWERYSDALRGGYVRPDILQRELERVKSQPYDSHNPVRNPGFDDYWVKLYEAQLADVPFIESVHRSYQRHIDRAWSRIFQALDEGALVGYGWIDLTQDQIREHCAKGLTPYDLETGEGDVFLFGGTIPDPEVIGPLLPLGAMVQIPRTEWSLGGVAPDARYVTAEGISYWDVVFSTEKLFSLFPKPLLCLHRESDAVEILSPGLAVSCDVGNGQATGARKSHQPGPGPGRKKTADGEVERACQALFGSRYASGAEKEAVLLAEAQDFTAKVWGEPIPRTTFQGYMKPFRALPEIAPEIAAE